MCRATQWSSAFVWLLIPPENLKCGWDVPAAGALTAYSANEHPEDSDAGVLKQHSRKHLSSKSEDHDCVTWKLRDPGVLSNPGKPTMRFPQKLWALGHRSSASMPPCCPLLRSIILQLF